ncbi:MAG: hypothetical protein U0469_01370 [Candidatus Paceibacterota bacterium]
MTFKPFKNNKKQIIMKKIFVFFALIFANLITFTSCKSPIWDREPVDTTYAIGFPLQEFHKLGEAGDTATQRMLVNQYRKQLTRNVMSHYQCVTNEKNVKFVFGSGKVDKVLSGDGKAYGGKFKNELIFIIDDPCAKDTVFLACGNGMLSPIHWSSQSDWGHAEKCRFVVEDGQSLAYFLPRLKDWGVRAEELGLPIANSKGKIVDDKIYMNYLGKWWSDHLFKGDVIDLCEKKITNHSGQKVDFERRLLETKKANRAILDAKIIEVKYKLQKISALHPKGKPAKLAKQKRLKELKAELFKLQSERKRLK